MSCEYRTGLGYDLHRLAAGRPLILGGVRIPFEKGLAGHSDADVLLHAITDALLGAANLGDIGGHFPPSDPQWKDASSGRFLAHARELIERDGYEIVHIDAVVVLERPKIAPHREAICRQIAEILRVDPGRVSLKGKTAEGVGPVGQGEAAEAHAVATVRRRE